MYEAIFGRLDALAAAVGLSRDSQRIRPGFNPWGYSGGLVGVEGRQGDEYEEGMLKETAAAAAGGETESEQEKHSHIEVERPSSSSSALQGTTALVEKK